MPTVAKLRHTGLDLKGQVIERRTLSNSRNLLINLPCDGVGGLIDNIHACIPDNIGTALNQFNLMTPTSGGTTEPSNWKLGRGGRYNLSYSDTHKAMMHTSNNDTYYEYKGYIKVETGMVIHMSCDYMTDKNVGGFYCGVVNRDGNKAYYGTNSGHNYFVASNQKPASNTWTHYKNSYTVASGVVYVSPMILCNYTTTDSTQKSYVKNVKIWVEKTGSPSRDEISKYTMNEGLVMHSTVNNLISSDTYNLYNNSNVPATITKGGAFRNHVINRSTFRVTTEFSSSLSSFQTSTSGHGISFSSKTNFTTTSKHMTAVYWRCVNKTDVSVSGTPSNVGGWVDGGTFKLEDGWNLSYAYRNGGSKAQSDSIFWGFKCPSLQLNESIIIEWAGLTLLADTLQHAMCYKSGNTASTPSFKYKLPQAVSSLSVAFVFTPTLPFENSLDFGINTQKQNSVLFTLHDEVNNGYIDFRYYTDSQGQCKPYLDLEGSYKPASGDGHYLKPVLLKANKEAYFIMNINSTNLRMYLFQEGQRSVEYSVAIPNTHKVTGFTIGRTRDANFILNNLTVYGSTLSLVDVTDYRKSKFTIDTNGDLYTRSLCIGNTSKSPMENINLSMSTSNLLNYNFSGFSGPAKTVTKQVFGKSLTCLDTSSTGDIIQVSPKVSIADQNSSYEISVWVYIDAKTAGFIALSASAFNAADQQIGFINLSTGASDAYPYFVKDETFKIPYRTWVQLKGYIFGSHVTSAQIPYKLNGSDNISDTHVYGSSMYKLNSDIKKISLRVLNHANGGAASTVYYALPTINKINPMKVYKDKATILSVHENAAL